MASAVALKVIQTVEQEGLVDNAAKIGGYLMEQLQASLGDHPLVGEIRGKGLLIGIELVEDRNTKVPLSDQRMASIVSDCLIME